jgi:Tfp pilus assembly pilus retraction ATPase PilT
MTHEQIRKVLAEIHDKVPESLRKNVVREVKATPTIEMVMQQALTMESIPDEKKAQIKQLLDAGEFSKVRVKEDPKIAKLIDQFISREINKAVKEGRLPSKATLRKMLKEEQN